MKRTFMLFAAVATIASMVPSQASTFEVQGHVRTAAITPTVPRMLHALGMRPNGAVGWVIELPPAGTIRPYSVHPVTAGPGAVDIDVWFYRDLFGANGTGDPCARDAYDGVRGAETGTACADARWAIVVLFTGSDVTFNLRVG